MPEPIAVCIEDFSPDRKASKFVSCVAIPGRQPGLRLDAGGTVLWKSDDAVACELWVSADDCLILYRPEGAPEVIVRRAGRSLNVPFGKPVVVIDQDEVDVGERKLRLHVHGQAAAISEPFEVVPKKSGLDRLKGAAAAVVLGSAIAAGGLVQVRCQPPEIDPPGKTPIDVRDQPPDLAPPQKKPPVDVRDQPPEVAPPEDKSGEARPPGDEQKKDETAKDEQKKKPPIDVRDRPPLVAPDGK